MSDFDGNQLIIQMISELRGDIKSLSEDVTKTREDISALKVKAGIASGFISMIISGLWTFFANSKH